ncbi:hypothetical protein BDV26DRAFT_303567 [Aspergillus bertholletiae]|uniref:SHSP domain-containing protein n=1 Tax=Aspergillus bertholletiae TaxID=1226010 RepID=A0A5N7BNA2_9EURO|nr:hypothetical protein BDV26DRAFT_303567 [Aspergillus bertholletiae]
MALKPLCSPDNCLVIVLLLWVEGIAARSFTFPTNAEHRFIVGDQVNITWDVVTPRISLYEECGAETWIIALNVVNKQNYVWTANRDIYRESGCYFELASLDSEGEPDGQDNVTSIVFGVAKRYHDDPSPTSYHFASTLATSLTATSTLTTTTTTSTESAATGASVAIPSAEPSSGGLSSAAKIGIGLGVPLGLLLLAVAVGLFRFLRRRKKSREKSPDDPSLVCHSDSITPLPGGFVDGSNASKAMRASHTDTIISELSSENYETRDVRRTREINELMGVERSINTTIEIKRYNFNIQHINSNMRYSCHFHQPPQAWEMDVPMLDGHPFFAHHRPPHYEGLFERHGRHFKGKMHKARHGMGDDELYESLRFGPGGRGGRGGRHHPHHPHHHHPYAFGFASHHGHGKFHPHRHEHGPRHKQDYGHDHHHEPEYGFNPWTKHDRSGPVHPGRPGFHPPHHRRGGPGPHFHSWGKFHHQGLGGPRGHEHGPGKRHGKGKGFHHFGNLSHMHPLAHAHHHHSRDTAGFMPPVDIFVTPTQTIIHASLPGAQKSDLSVGYDASRSRLRIAGAVQRPGVDEEMYRALLVEERGRHVGVFEREMPVSHDVVVEGIRAHFEDGVLKVLMPKVEGEKVQQGNEEVVEVEMVNSEKDLSTPEEFFTEGEEEEECDYDESEVEKDFVKVDIQ